MFRHLQNKVNLGKESYTCNLYVKQKNIRKTTEKLTNGKINGKGAGSILVYSLGAQGKLFLKNCKAIFLLKIKMIIVLLKFINILLIQSVLATSQVVNVTVHSTETCIRNTPPPWQLTTLGTYTSLVDTLQ